MALKKARNLTQDLLFILAVLGIVVAVNVVNTWVFKRADLTEDKQFSISPATKRILKGLDDIIVIKAFFSSNLPAQAKPLHNQVQDILTEFQAYAGSNLRVSWEDPKDDDEKKAAQQLGVQPAPVLSYEKDKQQTVLAYMSLVVMFEDRKEILPLTAGMQNLEYELVQAMMRVARAETPKVAVLKTDTSAFIPESVRRQMRINTDDPTKEMFKPIFENLKRNYEVELVDVDGDKPIDSKYRTLIVPGGTEFSEQDIYAIDQYFMNGGNLIVLVEGVKVEFQYGVTGKENATRMLKLMKHYGADVAKQLVLDAVCGQVQIPKRIGMFQMRVPQDYPYFVAVAPGGLLEGNPAVAKLGQVILPWVSPIVLLVSNADSTQKVRGEVLIKSSPKSWQVQEPFNLNPEQNWEIPTEGLEPRNLAVHLTGSFSSYFADKGKPAEAADTGADALSQIKMQPDVDTSGMVMRNSGAHLVVVGDADFASQANATPGNAALLQNLVDWLSLDENLIGIRSRTIVDRTIRYERLTEDSAMPNVIRWVNILVMPLLLIAFGFIIFLRRREPAPVSAPAPAAAPQKQEEENS